MENIFKIPKIESDDFHSQSMFILSYRMYILGFFSFLILSMLHVFKLNINFWVSFFGLILSIVALWYMKQYGKHIFIIKITLIISSVLVQISIFTLNNPDRFIDLIWIIIIVLYCSYTINIYWGISLLIVNFIGLTLYQFILPNVFFKPIAEYSIEDQVDYYLTIILGCILISYLLGLFFKTQRITNLKYRVANIKLRENNKIVIQQNHEKTIMLKEIHHRVKNNLQVITSLLRLQSKDIEDPEVLKQFREATNRVIAMSLIHEKMYQTKDLSKIDISSYFKTLTTELIRSYAIDIPIETEITTDLNYITPDYMVPLALLLNELTSNSLKHGFKDKSTGKISVNIEEIEENIEFSFSDDGVWDDSNSGASFGLELIDTLTEQLEGEFEKEINNGTHYHFKFPNNL